MFIKIHNSYRRVVAICDSELLGKKFVEGKKQLDVRESFYNGEKYDEERIAEMMLKYKSDDATFNIVGERAVNLGIETGIICEGNVGEVDGVKFALVLL